MSLRITILGLSITSSWGNGHATTWRALTAALAARGHDILFLECDKPWYAASRDLPEPPFCTARLYADVADLQARFTPAVRDADLVIVGSFVPDGVAVARWVLAAATGLTAFYDIDTPVTLAKLARGDTEYLSPDLIPCFDLYLSFTGGPTLTRLERSFGARMARALYCSVDPAHYYPEPGANPCYDLGYLGTYSADRQPALESLLLEPARRWPEGRFAVAGSLYPDDVEWPAAVERIDHLPPGDHRGFYGAQRFTLNITRADMVAAGWSPSVRLFEAAACGTPIISDWWPGLDSLFEPGREILIARSAEEVLSLVRTLPPARRAAIAGRARTRILKTHTSAHRARELEAHVAALRAGPGVRLAAGD